jgi:phosphatidylglycerophosphatase A
MGRLSLILSSGLGAGYVPKASGTVGTLWGVLFFYLGRNLSPWWWGAGVLLFFIAAVGLSRGAEKHLGSHDSSVIVIDEIVGYLVTVLGMAYSIETAALAFVLFRFFDIVKPFPIRQIDQKGHGAWSVVLDDVVAGIYANLVLRGALYFWEG